MEGKLKSNGSRDVEIGIRLRLNEDNIKKLVTGIPEETLRFFRMLHPDSQEYLLDMIEKFIEQKRNDEYITHQIKLFLNKGLEFNNIGPKDADKIYKTQ